ncbi:hypothetical protein D030_1998B, partial [Vibrio parahaemolyticus AQ3810]
PASRFLPNRRPTTSPSSDSDNQYSGGSYANFRLLLVASRPISWAVRH